MCACHRDDHVITAVLSCHYGQLQCAHECKMFRNLRGQPRYEDSLGLCSWALAGLPNRHKQIPSLKGLFSWLLWSQSWRLVGDVFAFRMETALGRCFLMSLHDKYFYGFSHIFFLCLKFDCGRLCTALSRTVDNIFFILQQCPKRGYQTSITKTNKRGKVTQQINKKKLALEI